MKGVITAAGLGTRSGLNGRIRKELLPIYLKLGGDIVLRPILDAVYSRMVDHGVNDIAIILNPADEITHAYIRANLPDATILHQERQRGFGDAVLQAREFIDGNDFLLNAGDGIILNDTAYSTGLEIHKKTGSSVLFLMRVEDPKRYGVAEVMQQDGYMVVKSVEEKPSKPKSNLALCATYIFNSEILGRIDHSIQANIELTPAIDALTFAGRTVFAVEVQRDEWISVGHAVDYSASLARTLDMAKRSR
ncbi:MAG: sugar phosphate nucleotidyltransferase [Candidatus Thermoplasmatota archaeon]|jgi:glucose-1-phosphate thymidylyltransferase|nr:sugar phosphate nucleotidyltransferase [Candidatus Thermoplasmatota archaeon]